MIQWASSLYIGDKLQKKKDRVIKNISNRKITLMCIVLHLHPNPAICLIL